MRFGVDGCYSNCCVEFTINYSTSNPEMRNIYTVLKNMLFKYFSFKIFGVQFTTAILNEAEHTCVRGEHSSQELIIQRQGTSFNTKSNITLS